MASLILPLLLLQVHFKVAACGRLLQTQAAMHISFKLDEQANHSAGELLKIVNQKTGLHQEDFPLGGTDN